MKQLQWALLLLVLTSCVPSQDDQYTLVLSTKEGKWLELEPVYLFGSDKDSVRCLFRVWYMQHDKWRWWQENRYDLAGGAVEDIPTLQRLRGDTIAIALRGHLQKYTFRGAWPAVQLYKYK